MKKALCILSVSFLFCCISDAAFTHLEDPAFYRFSALKTLPPQVQLYTDPADGYIETVFGEIARTQENLGVPGEHCVIRKLEGSFLYKESESKWFGVPLPILQEAPCKLYFNFLNASKRSARVTPLSREYTLSHGVTLLYQSPDGIMHSIKLDRNRDCLDLRLGPRSLLQFTVQKKESCDAVEILIHQSLPQTINDMMIMFSRLRRKSRTVPSATASETD